MKFNKRYEEFNIRETIEEDERKSTVNTIIITITWLIGAALWILSFFMHNVTQNYNFMTALMGAFLYLFGIPKRSQKKFKATEFVIMGYAILVFISAFFSNSEGLLAIKFMIGWVLLLICGIINGKEKKEKKKNYYRTSSGSGMFINELKDEFNEDRKYSFSDVKSVINEIKKQEEIEKEENGGKMISDSYLTFFSDMPKESKTKFIVVTALSILGLLLILPSMLFECTGVVLGGLFTMWGGLLRKSPPTPTDYNRNNAKYFSYALLIPGIGMIVTNLVFKEPIVVIWLVIFMFVTLLVCLLINRENANYMLNNATELIQAVCVDIEEQVRHTSEGGSYIELYPVFEIEYKGMRKRLKSRFAYKRPPEIGFKRILYINPNNLDEWYDPQHMKF